MSSEKVRNKITNLKPFYAVVSKVNEKTGMCECVSSDDEVGHTFEVAPPAYGGTGGHGLYFHPFPGDTLLCMEVTRGGKGITQAIRIIPKSTCGEDTEVTNRSADGNIRAGTPEYPINGMKPGEVRLRGHGGKINIDGIGDRGSGIFIGTVTGDGISIRENTAIDSATTIVGNSFKIANDATRISSRSVYRYGEGDQERLSKISINNKLDTQDIDGGKKKGLWSGAEASGSALLGGLRNPARSEYRFVANEFSETAYFSGWDIESEMKKEKRIKKYSSKKMIDSLSFEDPLHMAPHQLVEVIIGNVVNSRGEILDQNYNPIVLGDARGLPFGQVKDSLIYEEARLKGRRGIGYHFQLSTTNYSYDIDNSKDNFIFSIDKEGVLRTNIPASSGTGNVIYPSYASFYSDITRKIQTEYRFNAEKEEKIPVTLRFIDTSSTGKEEAATDIAVLPSVPYLADNEVPTRYKGVRFSNENNYFKGVSNTTDDPESVRINPTLHHNMYAAAEMLIANKISSINSDLENTGFTGFVSSDPSRRHFEIKGNPTSSMVTVTVSPGDPAIGTGGGTIVAGKDLEDQAKFANSFILDETEDGISAVIKDRISGEERSNAGGKSANINLEGSLELSIGKDNYDNKSILLDTAGGMVAWFGADAKNRSVIMQTDGDVLMNIGGHNGNSFNKGRFDLRVNVTDKGWVGEELAPDPDRKIGDSDFIISISENGLVIAGMKSGAPMVIRNSDDIIIESSNKLVLSGTRVVVREGAMPERPTYMSAVSADTPGASPEGVASKISNLAEIKSKKA